MLHIVIPSNWTGGLQLGISKCRFFCGPNAKKSDALAKQQKKRPRAGEANEDDSDDEDDKDFKLKKKKKGGNTPKTAAAGKGKQSGKDSPRERRSLHTNFSVISLS